MTFEFNGCDFYRVPSEIRVIDATADMNYVYGSDRLFFFEWRGARYAMMAFSSDDVSAQFDFLARSIADIVAAMTPEEAFLAAESLKRDPLLSLPYYEKAGMGYTTDYMGIRRKP